MSARDTEIEQVPLKSDMQPTAVTNNEGTEGEKTQEETAFKKSNEKVSKKICKIWQRHGPKSGSAKSGELEEPKSKKKKMSIGLDLINRDDKCLNEHIVMEFADVFAEPDASHSFNWTWLSANRVYSATSCAVYKLLAAFVAIPLALIFGVLFALSSLISVFLCTPLGVLLSVPLNAIAKVWDLLVRKLLTPISSSLRCQRNEIRNEPVPAVLTA